MIPATPEAVRLFAEGSIALAEVEHHGIRIDEKYLQTAIKEVTKKIADLEHELMQDQVYELWRKEFGKKANLGSDPQIAHIVFDKLGYESKEKTASGRDKTDKSAFENVDLPFVKKRIRWKELNKAKGTYLLGLQREVCNGFLHPFYHLAGGDDVKGGAVSYRSSSSMPNFQNMPIRDPEIGAMIRKCFIPREGNVIAEVDYGALEFRIAACHWKDEKMVQYASDNTLDIHQDTAADCYLLDTDDVTKETRYCGKNKKVFPILYGSYYKQCAQNLWEAMSLMNLKTKKEGIPLRKHLKMKGITQLGACDPKEKPKHGTYEKHVQGVEERFYARFPGFRDGKEKWWREYQERGWFQTMTGFVVSGVFNRNFLLNTPIQGPGFHCLLWSIIQQVRLFRKYKMKAKVVGQVHDCTMVDCPPRELHDVLDITKKLMAEDIRKVWKWIIVPMEAEVDVVEQGQTWFDKRPYHQDGSGKWIPKVKK